MSSLMFRQFQYMTSRHIKIRSFSSTIRKPFISNFFGSKEIKQRDEIIKNQDDYEIDPNSKIVILNKENSPDYKPFNAEVDMPDFKVNQWKFQSVRKQDIESTYSPEKLSSIISETYKELQGHELKQEDYSKTDLFDLSFRFKFSKLLQQKLGFDINDYVLSKSHTLEHLYNELTEVISTRWVSERNPSGIVLRPEDFSAPNIYLNQELTKKEQEAVYYEILEKAKES